MLGRPWSRVVGCVLALAAVSALSRHLVPAPADSSEGEAAPEVARIGPLPVPAPSPRTSTVTAAVQVPTSAGAADGMVVLPEGDAPPTGWPGMVLVHGSGDGRALALLPWAVRLAEHGLAVVVYDKRQRGYSVLRRDFDLLADDAVAAAQVLRSTGGVDPARVAMAGFSEGGWVVPLAGAKDRQLSGLAQLSGPDVRPGEQVAWQVNSGLRAAGAPPAARSALLNALALRLPRDLMAFSRFDPAPSWAAAEMPLLAVFGLGDATVPVEDGAANVLDARRPAGLSTTVFFVPDLGHGLRESSGGPSPTAVALVAAWVADPPGGPLAEVRGGERRQRYPVVGLAEPPGWMAPALLASSASILAGFVLNRVGRHRVGRARAEREGEAGRRVDRAALLAMVGGVGNHVGLSGLAVVGAISGGAVPATLLWGLTKLSSVALVVAAVAAGWPAATPEAFPPGRLRRSGAVLAGAGGLGLALLGGALTSWW